MGRDSLSDALSQRIRSLATITSRWTPEILHLLLELSDQPTTKSSLSSLQRLRPTDGRKAPALTWAHIAAEDGWASDRGIWQDIDFAESSDDGLEPLPQTPAQNSDAESSSSSPLASVSRDLSPYILASTATLDAFKESQQWRDSVQPRDASGRPTKIPLSEHQLVREVLFLLNGLPTDLFGLDGAPIPSFQLHNVSWETHRALVNSFAEHGRSLLPLRKFCEMPQDVALVQAFQSSVCQSLRAFDEHVALLQGRYVNIKADTIVSLIALQEQLESHLAPLLPLSNIVLRLQTERYAHSFRFLELLYDAICVAQSDGNEKAYCLLGNSFFDCFRVYIRPIREWMEDGGLTPGDKTFFVAESSSPVPLNQIWRAKYTLRRSQQGDLHAPRFLQPAVRKIFNTGKSIVVLKTLGRFREDNDNHLPEPPLDFPSVCGSPELSFAPFSELFEGAFDRWVQSKHLSTSSNLQAILFDTCGLSSNLDALEHLYFMADGSLADVFVSFVFNSLDSKSTAWRDRFTLTEVAQEAWSSCQSVESYRLSAAVEIDHDLHERAGPVQDSVRSSLRFIRLSYRLMWPIQLVITKEAIEAYQAVFTLLLQLRRASSILNSLKSHDPEIAQQSAYYAIRARLIWFTTTLHSYLTTLVLTPGIATMRMSLMRAGDLDAMIELHLAFTKRVVEEACLGVKLAPIRECILDMLDLAIRLEVARQNYQITGTREASEAARHMRLSTPQQNDRPERRAPPQSTARGLYISPQEKERKEDQTIIFGNDSEGIDSQEFPGNAAPPQQRQTYVEVLAMIRADFTRHLRFIVGGLRGAARASTDPAAAKWDLLAEMLEMGSADSRR